jgi:hypothetical protein
MHTKKIMRSDSALLQMRSKGQEKNHQDVTPLDTYRPFLRSADGPKVQAAGERKYDPRWDK